MAESPDCVKATRYAAPTRSATSAAALAMTPPWVRGCQSIAAIVRSAWSSVETMMRAIVSTTVMGCSPTLVSPESITASAPSSTALATSEASARVGAGLVIIDSSIWVATMTGLALRRALSMICFCRNGTSSSGHSTPRSPRATMNASNALTTSSRLSIACGFSILAMTGQHDALLAHHAADVLGVGGAAHEAERDVVDAELEGPAQVLDVLLGQRRHRDRDPGQVDALVVAHLAGDHDARRDVGVVDGR